MWNRIKGRYIVEKSNAKREIALSNFKCNEYWRNVSYEHKLMTSTKLFYLFLSWIWFHFEVEEMRGYGCKRRTYELMNGFS